MNPPKIFIEASVTAKKPIIFEKSSSIGPAAYNPPTIITEEIAFVTPISGECNAGVTLQTTK